jgi:hypothetical protein
MSLIVEDGSIVANANSYVTRATAIAKAALYGTALPDSPATDNWLRQAVLFMDSFDASFMGRRVSREQELAWPRVDVFLSGFAYHADEIPGLVESVQVQLAIDLSKGLDLYNRPDRQTVTRERVDGAVEVAYAQPNVVGNRTVESPGMRLLRKLFKRGGMLSIEAIRA